MRPFEPNRNFFKKEKRRKLEKGIKYRKRARLTRAKEKVRARNKFLKDCLDEIKLIQNNINVQGLQLAAMERRGERKEKRGFVDKKLRELEVRHDKLVKTYNEKWKKGVK